MRLRIGARRSDLARLQAFEVGERLRAAKPDLEIEYSFTESLGDKNLTDPLWKMPEKGVFTEDLSRGLRDGSLDLVVHSWKDLPIEERPGSFIAATLERADARDLILFKRENLPLIREERHLRLFSSSPRREYNLKPFLLEAFPYGLDSVEFHSVRGNIQTRVRKLLESDSIDALVVAKAAFDRLLTAEMDEFQETRNFLRAALERLDWMVAPLSLNPSAAAQGALAIEIPTDRADLAALMEKVNDRQAWLDVQEERAVLKSHGGGCHQKIGATVLSRRYGRLRFLRGLTDQGIELRERRCEGAVSETPVTVVKTNALFERVPLKFSGLPEGTSALFAAHESAWPDELQWSGYLWTAGWASWRKLAKRGLWVHGCSEGLGAEEDPRIATLAPDLSWALLTHAKSTNEGFGPRVATYDLKPLSQANPPEGQYLHWSSAVLFEEALTRWPFLAEKNHSCGPGVTWERLKKRLDRVEVRWPLEENT